MKVAWVLTVLLAFGLADASAAGPYRAPRNAVGQPDLEGIWTSNSLSRLERHDAYPSVVITEAQALAIRAPPVFLPDAVGQDETETYDDGAVLGRVRGEIRRPGSSTRRTDACRSRRRAGPAPPSRRASRTRSGAATRSAA